MPRVARKQSSSSIYHVVNRGNGKQIIFECDSDRSFFMKRLRDLLDENQCELLAWCLMDNHFHLLLEAPFASLTSVMHRLQTAYAWHFNKTYGRCGRLFGSRFNSEPVETDAYLMTVVRYIHENPKKAGAANGLSHPWSSYNEYTGFPVYIDPALVLNVFEGSSGLVAFHEMPHDEDKCLDIGGFTRSFGDQEAIRLVEKTLGANTLAKIKGLCREERNKLLRSLKDLGLGVRQIERLTGVSVAVISRA